ncbi:hypothetical protein PIB30_053863 [Stylosanthes scabra]|uniref:PUM-HD domain-containing protein n=1 Tax=Stylosanthes scabra TaxID=79078 RepID=A0ABU6QI34_9FABA|nr:hypothetical protein [Stylosanthes scabra]
MAKVAVVETTITTMAFMRDPSSVPLMLDLYNLVEVQGYVHNMAKDENGYRFLQRMVEEGTFEDVRVVFEGIVENVVELMMDPFGNYLVQKLLYVYNEDQRLDIWRFNFADKCLPKHSTSV